MGASAFSVANVIILLVGVIFLLWFLLPVLVTRNPNIGAVTGIGLSLLAILYGIWREPVNGFFRALWRSTGGRITEILLLVIVCIILGLAAATGICMISAASDVAQPGSTVIILGARVIGNRASTAMAGRIEAALDYLEDNPDSMCIVSGGQGKNEIRTEASMMYEILIANGIAPERIAQEDRSTDTQENLRYSRQLIEELQWNPQVAIATDGYHEYRALRYARQVGLEAGAVPAKTVWWLFPTSVIREMYGILEQWFFK